MFPPPHKPGDPILCTAGRVPFQSEAAKGERILLFFYGMKAVDRASPARQCLENEEVDG
jgi:hypothetical protein